MSSLSWMFNTEVPPKRNFIKENVKRLKDVQKTKTKPELPKTALKKSADQHPQKLRKAQSVTSLSSRCRNSASSISSRNASSQTSDVNDELFLKDVIIRIPSASIIEKLKTATSEKNIVKSIEDDDQNEQDHREDEDELEMLLNKTSTSLNSLHLIENSQNQQSVPASTANTNSILTKGSKQDIPPSYRYGEVPKYIQEIKLKKAEQNKLDAAVDRNCPLGHISLTEEERKESIVLAEKKYQNLVNELNKMPIIIETMRSKQRKILIETELNQLEEQLRLFSRQKVYVKIDE